jgi:hypothetical protein
LKCAGSWHPNRTKEEQNKGPISGPLLSDFIGV